MHIAAQSVELGDDHGTLELAGSGEEAINRSELFCTDSAWSVRLKSDGQARVSYGRVQGLHAKQGYAPVIDPAVQLFADRGKWIPLLMLHQFIRRKQCVQ